MLVAVVAINAPAQNFAPAAGSTRSIDEQIYRKIKFLPRYGVFDYITWQVNGNTVTLTGKVYSLGTKRDAIADVREIPGIVNVVDNIEELPPSPGDDRIRRAALIEFANRGASQYLGHRPQVHIIVERGRITLEGYVAHESDSNLMNVLANGIPGVFEVTNNLIVGNRRF